MSRAEQTGLVLDTRDDILERTPAKCRRPDGQACNRARMEAKSRARAVVSGEIALEAARQDYQNDLAANCTGSNVEGGCTGTRLICGYDSRLKISEIPEASVALRAASAAVPNL